MSELNEPGLNPSDAARILSNSRWGRDDEQTPVSDGTDLFGAQGVNASQGYTEMVPKHPVGAEDEQIDSAVLGAELLKDRQQVAEPIERAYYRDGDATAPRTPANETVSAEQASADVTRARQQDAAELERLESGQLAQEIDRLRGYDPTQALQQAQPEPQPQTPAQQEQQPQADDEVAKALQNPKVLAAVQEYTAQAQRQADAMAQYYASAVQQNAEAAAASIVSQWPELRGLNTQEQFRTAIQTVAATNPERAKAMVQHIEQTRAVINEQQRAAAAHQQASQQYRQLQWNHDAKLADDDFERWAATQDAPERVKEVSNNALELLRREGFGDQQIMNAWNSDPILRSAVGQKLLYMASKYDLAQRGIQSKAHNPVPTVQRPGSPEAREPEANYRQRQLSSRLDGAKGNEALRIAAEMIQSRRNARR